MIDDPRPLAVVDAFYRFRSLSYPPYESTALTGSTPSAAYSFGGRELVKMEIVNGERKLTLHRPTGTDVVRLNMALHRIAKRNARCIGKGGTVALSVWIKNGCVQVCEFPENGQLVLRVDRGKVIGVDGSLRTKEGAATRFDHASSIFDLISHLFVVRVDDHFLLYNGEGDLVGTVLGFGFYWKVEVEDEMESQSPARMAKILSNSTLEGSPVDIDGALTMVRAAFLVDSSW